MKRVLTALALIPIVVYVVLFANWWVLFAVVAAVAALCYHEYNAIAAAYGFGAPGPLGFGLGLLLLSWRGDAWPVPVAGALLILALGMRGDLAKCLPRASLLITGVVYVFGCWRFALPLREINPHWLMFALLVNWVGDAGAYYVGRPFGRHKMAPRVSPKKSWEGAAASVATAVIAGSAYLAFFVPAVGIPKAMLLAACANAAGQIGDLAESAMKRGAAVKDSGTLLPGHGGFLDRVDSTLFALPVVYGLLKIL
jgi:phosphatidate cytidylyltransferase